jgi:hypothetical protein
MDTNSETFSQTSPFGGRRCEDAGCSAEVKTLIQPASKSKNDSANNTCPGLVMMDLGIATMTVKQLCAIDGKLETEKEVMFQLVPCERESLRCSDFHFEILFGKICFSKCFDWVKNTNYL